MGNQQNQQKNSLKRSEQQQQIDIMSNIFEKQDAGIKQRAIEAIRISEQNRKIINGNTVNQTIEISEDFCRLTKKNSPAQDLNQKYILQGVLRKHQPNMLFSQLTERYCFLSNKKFKYNENADPTSKASGTLNFDLLSCYVVHEKMPNNQHFKVKVNGCDKQFVFSSAVNNENKKWVQALNNVTSKSFGRQYSLTYLSHYHRFWRKDYFSQKQFRQNAETGDIILMRGSTQSAMMQRAITQQQYDHVALVLKNIKDQILLFEANGAVGVGILPWHRFISKQYYKQQQIVVYRKLRVKRTKQFYEQFEQFVQRNVGRKYKFSVKKYLMNRQSTQSQDKKSYFCSSLVAKIYKNMQFLDSKVSSTQYMPHAFTQKQDTKLRQDGKYGPAKLDKQHIIVFEKLFFQKSN